MTRLLLILALFCVAVPAALAVPPAGKGKPEKSQASSQGAEKNAAKACKAERAKDSAAFKTKYGKNPNKANAFGKCVSMKAKKTRTPTTKPTRRRLRATRSRTPRRSARRNVARIGVQAFNDLHGTNPNKKNAFGKCVSKLAKAQGSSS